MSAASQDDGRALAGDSMPRSIRTLMANTVTREPNSEMTGINLASSSLSIKMDNDNKLSVRLRQSLMMPG